MFRRRLLTSMLVVATALGTALTADVGQASVRPAQSSDDFTLYTEPSAGFSWLYDQINDAQSSIDMTMYELSDTTAEEDLVAAAERGVDVRVILDEREKSTNDAAYTYLTDNGVSVVWSWTKYYYTHEKSIVFDDSTVDIMTLNLTSEYYSTSRDFAVVDTDSSDVAAVVKVFGDDYAHDSVTPGAGDDLVWSPTTAQTDLLDLIDNAQYSLQIFSEEMGDTSVIDALCDQAEDGVTVQLVGENESGEYDSEYSELYDCGVQISYYSSSTGFYIHGKSILADYGESSAKIFLGSQNFSSTSLTENRELGLIINDSSIESSVNSTFNTDFADGTRYTG